MEDLDKKIAQKQQELDDLLSKIDDARNSINSRQKEYESINSDIINITKQLISAKKSLIDNEPMKKGVNLVQLINDGQRWKILNMLWQDK